MQTEKQTTEPASVEFSRESIVHDFRIGYRSRQASLIGRKEVLTGKAKFGIFGDGKEVAQLAMARAFRKGDLRSGYYRDQTFMLAAGMTTVEEFFAQLYANPDIACDPASGGRSMNCHFASRTLEPDGSWRDLTGMPVSSPDLSPTGSQMPRLVGLGYASRLYREIEELRSFTRFSHNGDEVAFGTIGNASCAEGMFWESVNAIGVLGAPVILSIWDDNYGISVPNEFQIAKGNLSEVLSGFQRRSESRQGFDLYTVRGWDYPSLCETYINAAAIVRMEHVPAILHVVELTQPQGHSTSGSHERYKSRERLEWEEEYDCIRQMREWMIFRGIAGGDELDRIEAEEREHVRHAQKSAWESYRAPVMAEMNELLGMIAGVESASANREKIAAVRSALERIQTPMRRDLMRTATEVIFEARTDSTPELSALVEWRNRQQRVNADRYDSDLYSESEESPLKIEAVEPQFSDGSPVVNGFEVINACFDAALERMPNLFIMGEDVGHLGDVNQGCAGLQEKYGVLRVSDTGIRECTIIGQAIGMALRGLRPIAEIQYLDYVLYALQIMSDDLATVRWRTRGGQKAPVIIRTRGHRLEGIWHSGSPMAGILNLVRGMHVCVPRNMEQAAGMYNTLLRGDDPAILVEVLNGYRAKERRPNNIGDFTVPLGAPEILREGSDVTIVTYGASCRIVLDAADLLARSGIHAEVIDVQTLLPFDLHGKISESLEKTSRVVFVDEDVPGGTTAFMLRNVLEVQHGYELLDSEPRTVTGKPHRPAYGSDGDYWSKPNRESIFEAVYALMHDAAPARFPIFWKTNS
ncbi:MAG: thiamine pyrophosphate-dependent enzyme [Thermoanaerobaculia bacterium]